MENQSQHGTLIERIVHQAEKNPNQDAIVTSSFTVSYARLLELVQAQITKFNDLNVASDSVIGIKCADDTKHLLLCLAATHFGATTCTIPTYEGPQAQKAVISSCGATHIVDENFAVNPLTQESNVGSTGTNQPILEARFLFSTSGTTGDPKLVVHWDSDLVAQAHRHIESEQQRFACVASIEQNFAKRHRLYCVAMGATNIFLDVKQAPLVAQCHSLNVSVLHVSAFQARELLAMPNIESLSNIRLKLGGSHVPLLLRQQLRNGITKNLQAGYGTTETGAIGFTDPDDENAGVSVGQPLPGIEIRAVTPERHPVEVGEKGELAIRCEGMFRGYLSNTQLTDSRLENSWFYTGDIGYLDEKRRIHLCGRSDDMFVFNSMNIYPQDIESKICEYPKVIDAAVLPKASTVHGNIPVALVVFADGVKPNLLELKKFMRQQLGVRSPRQFTLVKEIPRNTTGKISRNKVKALSAKNDQIRKSIIQTLMDTGSTEHIKPSLITAFENGERDIELEAIGMDSLARMELMIAMEIQHDAIIMPHEFPQLRSLNDIVSCVLTKQSLQEEPAKEPVTLAARSNTATIQNTTQPHVIRFFQRIFRYCHSAAHLNKALFTLEGRLTPAEIDCLNVRHNNGQLLPKEAAAKFQTVLTLWFQLINRMMLSSGKSAPEAFISHKISRAVRYFVGPGSSTNKTLLICFSTRSGNRLTISNGVLLQHTDSSRHDLLIISEPLGKNYNEGVPGLGKNLIAVIEWLSKQEFISNYHQIRTLGCSAGGYAALVAAHLLWADMAVSVGGRFPSRHKHPLIYLNMIFTIWRVMRKGHCPHVLVSYSKDKSRDRKFAKIMARLSSCTPDIVKIGDEKIGHNVLLRLVEHGELAQYFARSILSET
jgi:acyl-coenzyme A synthetase/AMP-(fatty) acid ligase